MANISELNQYGKNIVSFKTSRSSFPLDNENVLTLKAGDIVPLWHMDILPGDTIQLGFSFVMRMLTPVNPTMDNAFIDFYSFFIPNRLLTEKYHLTTTDEGLVDTPKEYGNWKTFFTENENGAWDEQETTYLKLYTVAHGVSPQSVADYLGLPIGNTSGDYKITNETLPNIYNSSEAICNGLAFAGLDLIYNEWFRNENLEAPTIWRQNGEISGTRTNYTQASNTCYIGYDLVAANDRAKRGSTGEVREYPYKATKFADLFTNCLPEPYKLNTDIVIGLAGEAPVKTTGTFDTSNSGNFIELGVSKNKAKPNQDLTMYVKDDTTSGSSSHYLVDAGLASDPESGDYLLKAIANQETNIISSTGTADLSEATSITINELRNAITIQHIAEAFARGGTRYSEILHGIYGTAPDDITLERPELLGAKRFPVNTTQVVNAAITSSGDLGELGAYSHTTGSDQYLISKSFKEHGQVFVVAVIRTSNKYFQGINKEMSKNKLFDFYFPQFAGLGEQAVLNKEIYLSGDETTDNEVFGYQEAFYEEHYKKDELHGLVNPCSGDETLASYTYQVPFTTTPALNKDFDTQHPDNIGNVLYDTTTISQFLLDIYFNTKAVREMPIHAIPGVERI